MGLRHRRQRGAGREEAAACDVRQAARSMRMHHVQAQPSPRVLTAAGANCCCTTSTGTHHHLGKGGGRAGGSVESVREGVCEECERPGQVREQKGGSLSKDRRPKQAACRPCPFPPLRPSPSTPLPRLTCLWG
jgi:hypothetical protein